VVRESTQFLDSSPGVPKMVLSKMGQAHNKFPDAAQTDPIAARYIRGVLNRPDLCVFLLASDHGYGYQGVWEKHEGSDFERLLPNFVLFVPNEVLKALPDGGAALTRNQQRLVSAFDIHLTLKSLLLRPGPAPTKQTILDNGVPMGEALDLLNVEVPRNRTCRDAGIMDQSCVCNSWKEVVPTPSLGEGTDVKKAVDAALHYINKRRTAFPAPEGAGPSSCLEVVSDGTVQRVQKKAAVTVGFHKSQKEGYDNRFGDLMMVEFGGTLSTLWQAIAEFDLQTRAVKVRELNAMHRYAPRKACWDGYSPLKYCACALP
jgi:hypothetical protein